MDNHKLMKLQSGRFNIYFSIFVFCLFMLSPKVAYSQGHSFWEGKWTLTNAETNTKVGSITVTRKGETLSGSYVVTPMFCQTNFPNAPSSCPSTGHAGTFKDIGAIGQMFYAYADCPFNKEEELVINMTTLDYSKVEMSSIIADGMRLSILISVSK